MDNDRTLINPEQAAWEAHNVSQITYFRSLSLREKMHAVQGMADVVRRFDEMRARGEFHVLADGRRADMPSARRSARQSGAPYVSDRKKDDPP